MRGAESRGGPGAWAGGRERSGAQTSGVGRGQDSHTAPGTHLLPLAWTPNSGNLLFVFSHNLKVTIRKTEEKHFLH